MVSVLFRASFSLPRVDIGLTCGSEAALPSSSIKHIRSIQRTIPLSLRTNIRETRFLEGATKEQEYIYTMSASPVNNSSNGAAAPTSVNEARDPSGFLSEIIGAPVTVKLNSGVVYRGV